MKAKLLIPIVVLATGAFQINDAGEKMTLSFEGIRTKAYRCIAGVLSIGGGHTGKDVYEGQVITVEKAKFIFRKIDAPRYEKVVLKAIKRPLTQGQFNACFDIVYNCGDVLSKTTLGDLIRADHQLAAGYFKKYSKFRNPRTKQLETSRGLLRRRIADSAMYQTVDGNYEI